MVPVHWIALVTDVVRSFTWQHILLLCSISKLVPYYFFIIRAWQHILLVISLFFGERSFFGASTKIFAWKCRGYDSLNYWAFWCAAQPLGLSATRVVPRAGVVLLQLVRWWAGPSLAVKLLNFFCLYSIKNMSLKKMLTCRSTSPALLSN